MRGRIFSRWALLAVLGATLLGVPAPAREAPRLPDEKAKELEALQKQIAELQQRMEELKKAPTASRESASIEGTLPVSVSEVMKYRQVGPANMGGRVTALAVHPTEPTTYFVATGGGGLLKTVNNGTTFSPVFDNQTSVSIGDVAVSPSNPDIVWVGTGEANPRNSVSYGDGVYKSTDDGKTWTNMGLKATFQIGKILIHPKNPDVVYVGALGRLYGPNPERGLFKTTDGGKNWSKVLFVDDNTGVIDARLDPQDPDTLIVGMWERKRDEFDGFFGEAPVPDSYGPIVTHGAGGGLFKSTDGGKSWKKLNDPKLKNGLPTVKTGRIGLDYSAKTKGLLVAIIDTEKVGTGDSPTVYLGIQGVNAPNDGGARIQEVTAGGPSEKAGLKANDVVIKVDGEPILIYDDFVESYSGKNPGDKIKVVVKRGDKEETLEITLAKRDATTPEPGRGGRGGAGGSGGGAGGATRRATPILGVQLGGGTDKLILNAVVENGPAAKAGLKAGDEIISVDGQKMTDAKGYAVAMQDKKPGDKVKVVVKRDGQEKTFEVTLGSPAPTTTATPVPAGPTLALPGFTPSVEGELKVASLPKDSPVAKAGVKVGDEVVAVNGDEVTSLRSFLAALRVGPRVPAENARKAGDKVKVTFKLADGSTKEVEVALVDTPVQGLGSTGPARGETATRPYGLGLGGQKPNVTVRQGKDGYQTGGIYISKDNGDTWTRVNSLNARPMYFSVVRFDPTDDNTIYTLADVPVLYKSTNGGKRFTTVRTSSGVHADAHTLWINPANAKNMIIGCDGGFYKTYDQGLSWDHINTIPLGQFYHVAVDNRKPYRIYGGLQDNGSWGGPSHTLRRYGPVNEDWVFVSGGDGFVCRVDPVDPDIVYAQSQGGFMSRRNFRTGEFFSIRPPRNQGDEALRFNWNTPFILSSHNSSIFYCGAQFVFRSLNKGANLKQISPDLTKSKKGSITQIAESPRNAEVLYAGTDDGNVWVTKNGGLNWENITANFTSAGLPGPRWVNCIETSREKEGRVYVVFDAHRSNDDKPYVFVSEDFGKTWTSINANLPTFGSSRVLREDLVNPNLLFLGTEFGVHVTLNRGKSWTKLGGNLPTVRVDEFAQPTTASELVVGTHGRSIWILDIHALRQMKAETLKKEATVFQPAPATRWKLGVGGESPYSVTDRKFVGTNPTRGGVVEYLLTKDAKKVTAKVLDATGKTVHTFERPETKAGFHQMVWNLTTSSTQSGGGRRVAGAVQPGLYKVVVTIDEQEFNQTLLVELDPNAPKDVVAIEGFEEADSEYQLFRKALTRPQQPQPSIKD